MEKRLTTDLQHDTMSTVNGGSDRTAQVIQSDMNLRKTGKIIDCRIVCNIFRVCNNIIYLALKKHISTSHVLNLI